MSRIKDFESRPNIQKLVTAQGQIIGPFNRRGETRFQCLVEGATTGNTIQPQGRLFGQTDWQNIGSALSGAIAAASTNVDHKNFDEIRFNCSAFVAAGQTNRQQTLTPDAAPDEGTFKIQYGTEKTTALAFDASAATIQAALRLLTGLGQVTVSGTLATAITIVMVGVKPSLATAFSVVESSLEASNVAVVITQAVSVAGADGSDVKFIASGFWD